LRRLVTKQIHFAAKVECVQYEGCLSTFNEAVINNIHEIRENAIQNAAMREDEVEFNTNKNNGNLFGQVNMQK
jgi:hypothetical protein